MKLATPKGFRDFLPADALRRRIAIGKITATFEKFGFDPLETPTLEFVETLMGKYGEEEKLIYQFETRGGDKVAMKYDQTVPLARVVAQYGPVGMQKLPMPFKRYQIQSAFRGENTQKGRYREFLQCDADIIGVSTPLADAEILGLVYEIYNNLGLKIKIKVNDRSLLADFEPKHLAAVDKLNKIGLDKVIEELIERGLTPQDAAEAMQKIKALRPSPNLEQIFELYKKMGYPEESLMFDPTLVRGLDYYTGIILEVVLENDPLGSSLCGGGRWDNMIGKFTGTPMPAIGFAIGLDRTIEAMLSEEQMGDQTTTTKVLITFNDITSENEALEILNTLRAKGVNAEIWLDPSQKMEKQLRYAEIKGIPYAILMGVDKENSGQIILKDIKQRTQEVVRLDEIIQKLTS